MSAAIGADVTEGFRSSQGRLGVVAGHREQLVGDRGVALVAQLGEFLLQPAHLGPQDRVLLDYSKLRGCYDVTEQGLGHNCNGLSERERVSPAPRRSVGA